MIAVNLRSVFLCSKAVLPGMARRGFGRIINISSQLGCKGAPNMAHYAAAKAAIIGFTRSLAREAVQDGINVNAICPGAIATDLGEGIPSGLRARRLAGIPLGRFGAIGEIAPTAVLLTSSEGDCYPNFIPLGPASVRKIACMMEPRPFDAVHRVFCDRPIATGAEDAPTCPIKRHLHRLNQPAG